MNITDYWFGRWNTDIFPVKLHHITGAAEVKVFSDSLKKYDPDYNKIVSSKSCLNKVPFVFELFISTYHFLMTCYINLTY